MHSFGSLSEQYSRNNIEGCLYIIADGYEQAWRNPAKKDTFEVEYKRRSSLAESLHLIYKLYHFRFLNKNDLEDNPDLEELIKERLKKNWTDDFQKNNATEVGQMEHQRWIAYMRSIGYSKCTLEELLKYNPPEEGKPIDTKNHFLKKHIAIVPYSSLRKISRKLEDKGTKRNLQYQTDHSVMSMKEALLNDVSLQDYDMDLDDFEKSTLDDPELER